MAAKFVPIENRLRKIAAQKTICLFSEVYFFSFFFFSFFFFPLSQLRTFLPGSILEGEKLLYYILIYKYFDRDFIF